jgi:hypothetical protein
MSGYFADEDAGLGGEMEVVVALADRLRLGGRFSVENAARWGGVFTAGARLHVVDTFAFGADVFYITRADNGSPAERTAPFGVTLGFGIEGDGAWVIGASELLLAALVVVGRAGGDD